MLPLPACKLTIAREHPMGHFPNQPYGDNEAEGEQRGKDFDEVCSFPSLIAF